jgi:hypothetical protein
MIQSRNIKGDHSHKVGVTYNVYDGIELLQHSIDCIREHVDYINVVWQDVSNRGEVDDTVVDQLMQIKGIDEMIYYKPNLSLHVKVNETIKRQIGYDYALANGCDIWLNMDTDEMYKPEQFKSALQMFIDGGYDSSACQMITFYKFDNRAIFPFEDYYVPLFFRCKKGRTLGAHKWDVVCDMSRKMEQGKLLVYTREQIEMHHYSMIRKDFAKKIRNKSAAINWPEMVERYAQEWEKCTPDTMTVMHPHRGTKEFRKLTLIDYQGCVKVNIQ